MISFRGGRNGTLPKLGGIGWNKETAKTIEESFATEAFVGPKGAGKSLLAFGRAYEFSQGNKRDANGFCLCGDITCNAKWTVYTNLESPTLPEYGSWAKTLDLMSQMADVESEDLHSIILIDEATQYFDSRKGQMREIIKMLNQITMLRKKTLRLMVTGISFDWMDKRLREQTSLVYNCWTSNRGVTTSAVVHNLATGNIPPWLRANIRPQIKLWFTAKYYKFYNTNELVNAEADIQALRTEPNVYLENAEGELEPVTLSEIAASMVVDLVDARILTIKPEDLAQRIKDTYPIPVTRGYIRDWLIETGFMFRQETGEFILRVEKQELVT